MGVILLLALIAGLGVSLVLLVPSVIASVYWTKGRPRGYWLVHVGLAIVIMLMMGGIAALLMQGDGKSGAPSEEDLTKAFIAFLLIGLAPGVGSFLGLLCYLKPRPALPTDEA